LNHPKLTEADFQKRVVQYAQRRLWLVAHFPRANPEGRWRTAVAADAKGYPDLTMARDDRLVVAELKGAKGRLRPEQERWIERLGRTGVEVYVWKPADWDEIVALLA
jgi:hypothetical protein